MKLQKMLSLAATMIALPAIGFAEEAPKAVPTDMIWIMNTLLFLIGGFLVFKKKKHKKAMSKTYRTSSCGKTIERPSIINGIR